MFSSQIRESWKLVKVDDCWHAQQKEQIILPGVKDHFGGLQGPMEQNSPGTPPTVKCDPRGQWPNSAKLSRQGPTFKLLLELSSSSQAVSHQLNAIFIRVWLTFSDQMGTGELNSAEAIKLAAQKYYKQMTIFQILWRHWT